MYACPHCSSTKMFMAFKDGILVKVLEDNQDVDGLEAVGELLCSHCNRWFPNPQFGDRELTGELVTITGLKGRGTIKVVATGITLPFHYASFESEAIAVLREAPKEIIAGIMEFSMLPDHTLGLRVKEEGNPNTWVYRLNTRRVGKALSK